jgi:CheY-like chemotaxis protein
MALSFLAQPGLKSHPSTSARQMKYLVVPNATLSMADPHPRFRVLLVVHDAAERSSLEEMLEPDFELVATGSPADALARLQTETFEVLLLDQKLDGQTGAEVAAQAAGLPGTISTILLCEPAEDLSPAERSKAKVLTVLLKPWHAARLVRLLEQSARLTLVHRAADALQKLRGL